MRKTRSGCNMAELKLVESNMPDWQKKYEEAVKLIARICVAESELFLRLQQMPYGPTHRDEAMAIYDAVHALRVLRCELYARTKQKELALLRRRSA
jgi:hypothetical protein